MPDGTGTSPTERCPGCGADAGDNFFDRSVCPEPCGKMHQRCRECGLAQDRCEWEVDSEAVAYFNRLYREESPR